MTRRRSNHHSRRRAHRRTGGSLGRALLLFLLALCFVAGAALATIYQIFAADLPTFDGLIDYRPKESTKVFAADGTLVGEFFEERRTVIPPHEIPEVLKRAILAAEDAHFYEHEGLDYVGMARAFWKNLTSGETRQGGSTITQQVVKTFLLSPERTYTRKIKEAILARRLEKNLSKDEILYLYLNQIYFGHGRYGVEEAAQFYFGKKAAELDLAEAALLAGLPQSPGRLSPLRHPDRAKQRQRYVLGQMLANGWIDQRAYDEVVDAEIRLAEPPPEPPGPYYLEEVRRILVERYGAETVLTGGLRVYVAMDPALQRAADRAVRDNLVDYDRRHGYRGHPGKLDPARRTEVEAKGEGGKAVDVRTLRTVRLEPGVRLVGAVTKVGRNEARIWFGGRTGRLPRTGAAWALGGKDFASFLREGDLVHVEVARVDGDDVELSLWQEPEIEGALVSIEPQSRRVVAMVGGYDFARSSFNRATQARRQPGSTFKPFVFGAALESGRWTPASLVVDAPETFRDPWTGKDWKPQNYERNRFDGTMTLRRALATSKNTVPVRLISELGPDAVIDFARRAGIRSELPKNFTLALGTGDVTPLELANAYATLAAQGMYDEPVLIERVEDRRGVILEEAVRRPQPTISPALAYVLTRLLQAVVEEGTGRRAAVLERPTAGKTGTTSDNRDAWFAGYTTDLVTVTWAGFDEPRPLGGTETGGRTAVPAWVDVMQAAHRDRPPRAFPVPEGVEFAAIDPQTGLLAPIDAPPSEVEETAFVEGTAPTERAIAPGLHPADAPLDLFLGGGR
ncbi:MAG TPA: PBP1A family penicillin-binding protein [Fredinandcohnia sp.]|nr:PBP1A family penicillin-binding protein [Fredinandcohnia sp.]